MDAVLDRKLSEFEGKLCLINPIQSIAYDEEKIDFAHVKKIYT